GQTIALVCDAGTPAISDPGFRLTKEALGAGIKVVPLPGASALVAALSASGLPTDRFTFEGFLPAKTKERRVRLQALVGETRTLIFYEAPHRLIDSLRDIQEIFGEREIVIAREITKLHEEFLRGPITDVLEQLSRTEPRGEITLLVHGSTHRTEVDAATI